MIHSSILISRRLRSAQRRVLCFCLGILATSSANAWENNCSHPRITKNAIDLLNPSLANNNYYFEFSAYQYQLEFGAKDEDNPKFSVLNHFYDPKTLLPMHDAANSDNQAMFNIELTNVGTPQTTAIGRGEYWWNRADYVYANGNNVVYNVANYWPVSELYSPTPFVRWDVPVIPARSAMTFSYEAHFRNPATGGPLAHTSISGGSVEVMTTSWANQLFAAYPVGGAP
jgi:hypothetical protein